MGAPRQRSTEAVKQHSQRSAVGTPARMCAPNEAGPETGRGPAYLTRSEPRGGGQAAGLVLAPARRGYISTSQRDRDKDSMFDLFQDTTTLKVDEGGVECKVAATAKAAITFSRHARHHDGGDGNCPTRHAPTPPSLRRARSIVHGRR